MACESHHFAKSCRRSFNDVISIEPTAAVFDAVDNGPDNFNAGQLESLVRLIHLIDPALVPQHRENGASTCAPSKRASATFSTGPVSITMNSKRASNCPSTWAAFFAQGHDRCRTAAAGRNHPEIVGWGGTDHVFRLQLRRAILAQPSSLDNPKTRWARGDADRRRSAASCGRRGPGSRPIDWRRSSCLLALRRW